MLRAACSLSRSLTRSLAPRLVLAKRASGSHGDVPGVEITHTHTHSLKHLKQLPTADSENQAIYLSLILSDVSESAESERNLVSMGRASISTSSLMAPDTLLKGSNTCDIVKKMDK